MSARSAVVVELVVDSDRGVPLAALLEQLTAQTIRDDAGHPVGVIDSAKLLSAEVLS